VHITELGGDYFQYDEARHELRGERTGKRFQLTDRVTVKVARVDLEARKIDLVLAGSSVSEDTGAGKPKSSAHKALDAKPGKSRKQGGDNSSRFQLAEASAEPEQAPAKPKKRAKSAAPSDNKAAARPAKKAATKTSNKKR
jgi:ribonuclease R